MLSSFVSRKKTVTSNVSRQELAKILWEKEAFVWVDLEEPNEFESEILIELFNFHPLAIEDCLNDQSDPKIDEYEDHFFLVVHAVNLKSRDELRTIELDIFVSKNYLVTFHKEPIPSITQIRDWVDRRSDSPITEGADLLLHAILDRLVDNYLSILTEHERRIDEIEDQLFRDGGGDLLQRILKLQKDVLYLRRIITPQQETIGHLTRSTLSVIRPKNLIYFRDITDHLFRFRQMAEETHGLLTGVLQVYFSHVSTKLNEVIKALTIIATLALPPLVIASIYGMNFKHMPELFWEWGYYVSLGLMTLSSAIVLLFLKWKKWF